MMSMTGSHCDCCGLPISSQMGENCPRCDYPIAIFKEEQFLILSLRDLHRVAKHGGAGTTVAQLITRYQNRLDVLRHAQQAPAPFAPRPFASAPQAAKEPPPTQPVAPVVQPVASPVAASTIPVPEEPIRVFSLKSFFADQTINVVVSLAAFLILIGALGYVATNSNFSNLFLSFIVMFIAHAAFGLIGITAYWFRARLYSLRIIAVVYTAIFALLVPLVGFSGYRLVAGHIVQLSPGVLVAVAAIYAALVYGSLATYQRFILFGYLAVAALATADLALAYAFNLGLWWWPSALVFLAFPCLFVLPARSSDTPLFRGMWAVLREPVRALMFACVGVCGMGALLTYFYSLGVDITNQTPGEIRFSLLCMLLLLLVWVCLFVWCSQQVQWAQSIPYLFLASVLAFAYVFEFRQLGYVLILTGAALFYHGLTRLASQLLQRYNNLEQHLEGIALVLVGVLPLIAEPLLPVKLLLKAYSPPSQVFSSSWGTLVEIMALLVGCALTVSVVLRHTGWQKTPETGQKRWPWLLLLGSLLLNWAYGMAGLLLPLEPAWWFLSLTMMFAVCAVMARRGADPAWADPLDVLVLVEAAITLGLSLNNVDRTIFLLFFFAVVSYGVLLYRRSQSWLFLPLLLLLLAAPLLLLRMRILLVSSIALPLVAAVIHTFITNRWHTVRVNDQAEAKPGSVLPWEWPLFVGAIVYGLIFTASDSMAATSAVQGWLPIRFPFALEMTLLAVIWYASAALARVKWWSVMAVAFAVIGLLVPTDPFWVLALLAPGLALLALAVSRLIGKGWAVPLYSIALFAAVMMGLAGHTQQEVSIALWVLLLFALLIYFIGVVEDAQILMWIAPFFVTWSVYDSGLLGDLYRPPLVALACAALGAEVSSLKFAATNDTALPKRSLYYALPIYVTALASAALSGVYGTLQGVNHPFYAAIPEALLLYALVAYGIVLLERRPMWQWLVVGFATWGTMLVLRTTTCLQLLPITFFPTSVTATCSIQVQTTTYSLVGIAFAAGILGILAGRFIRYPIQTGQAADGWHEKFAWNWSWYVSVLMALVVTVWWSASVSAFLPQGVELGILCALIALSLLVMLVERVPELLGIAVALALWSITRTHWPLWQQMIAYSVLWMLVFASQFIWKVLAPATRLFVPMGLYSVVSIGGQLLVVLAIILQGGLVADTGLLAHVGAGSLLVLTLLIFCYGSIRPDDQSRPWFYYGAGLLLSLVVSWELSAFRLTHIDWLALPAASYLIIVAPFIARDQKLPQRHMAGQVCSIVGAALLFLPMIWLSFSQVNLQPTLILASEALVLMMLGIATHLRFFILSGAALIIVSAIHALFLPSLGIPFFLAIIMAGVLLLGIATGLTLARHRLPSLWSQAEP